MTVTALGEVGRVAAAYVFLATGTFSGSVSEPEERNNNNNLEERENKEMKKRKSVMSGCVCMNNGGVNSGQREERGTVSSGRVLWRSGRKGG